jgi:hypothetical protein
MNTCEDAVFGRVTAFEIPDNPGNTIGVGPIDVGLEHVAVVNTPFRPHVEPIAVADSRSPLTAVSHEFYHELNYFHAGPNCPGVDLWIWWPPDDKGFIQGVGLDRHQYRNSAGVWNGQYRILMPGTQTLPGGKENYYDVMSYCAGESDAWISVQNWNKFDDALPNGPWPQSFFTGNIIPPSASAVSRKDAVKVDGGTLLVSAVMDATGRARYLHLVRTGNLMPKAPDTSTSDFVFVVRDAEGTVLARVPSLITQINGHGAAGTVVVAAVPAKGAASVELEHKERTIGVLRRSAATPKLKLKVPNAGVSLARSGPLRVEWAASDADSKGVEIRIEYSPGPKKPFRPVYAGPNRGSATIRGSTLEASDRGRLRLVASDGFNETAVITGPIKVQPVPPMLTILTPQPKASFPRSTPVRLEAAAFGNNRMPLRGKKLTWVVDGRRAGNGLVIELRGLKLGRHDAKVVAQDGSLKSTRQVTFTIRPANGLR